MYSRSRHCDFASHLLSNVETCYVKRLKESRADWKHFVACQNKLVHSRQQIVCYLFFFIPYGARASTCLHCVSHRSKSFCSGFCIRQLTLYELLSFSKRSTPLFFLLWIGVRMTFQRLVQEWLPSSIFSAGLSHLAYFLKQLVSAYILLANSMTGAWLWCFEKSSMTRFAIFVPRERLRIVPWTSINDQTAKKHSCFYNSSYFFFFKPTSSIQVMNWTTLSM